MATVAVAVEEFALGIQLHVCGCWLMFCMMWPWWETMGAVLLKGARKKLLWLGAASKKSGSSSKEGFSWRISALNIGATCFGLWQRRWKRAAAFPSVLLGILWRVMNWEEILLFEVRQFSLSTLLCAVAAGRTPGADPWFPHFIYFQQGWRVKPLEWWSTVTQLSLFLRGACMRSRFSLTLSAGGNYN